jgi:hypothetical protein
MKSAVMILFIVLVMGLVFGCGGKYGSIPAASGLYPVKQDGKYGFIDKTGKIIINPQFNNARSFSEGLASVCIGGNGFLCQGGNWGFIDKTGKIIINPQFDFAFPFSEGLANVNIGNKYGYIDKTGKIVINPQFDDADDFSEGLASVCKGGNGVSCEGGKWGYIDKTGKYIWNPTE